MSMLPIFYVQTGTIFDWDVVVNALAENSRKVVLKIIWMEINMHETAKVN